ncbi:hypothetical protein OG562_14040 [Streptomyces sp. NBC_01275]|uniref:hypothetical protein n=1 Tax=Streptomyces sp. NBC_01275 TaxID=2903807 RepID=UPI00224F36CB|nr:hypothetical protein [Streptomyces sp. NBC_01275]MCX4762075.1 hypothetical protein [Streptomyces sp. NBC_01275]
MRDRRRPRRLTVDETTAYLWTVRHAHGDGEPCREILTLLRDGVRTRIVFREGRGRYVGSGYPSHSGGVGDARHHLNLHEPGVVRALLDEARRRGLLSSSRELDGWELLPAAAAAVSRRAAATPEAPPDCPPDP